jgi:hypothetical protein
LERARAHVYAFHEAVEGKLGVHPILYDLTTKFEPNEGAIVCRVQRSIEVDDGWSLIVGDAVHNLRGALDHLAWQLAKAFYGGREPTYDEGPGIQFPIEPVRTKWAGNKYRRSMLPADAAKLENFQPFNRDSTADGMRLPHPLIMLRDLSNADKHRRIQLTSTRAAVISYANDGGWIDCEPLEGSPGSQVRLGTFYNSPQAGDEIFRFSVKVTGKNPNVELQPSLSCFIAVREWWNVEDALTLIATRIEELLRLF